MATFQHYKGSDRNIIMTWTQSGSPLNITGAVITANFARKTTDTAPVLTKSTTGGGITLTTPASGIATINMDEADFSDLSAAETELTVGVTMVLSGRTYKQSFSVNVLVVP